MSITKGLSNIPKPVSNVHPGVLKTGKDIAGRIQKSIQTDSPGTSLEKATQQLPKKKTSDTPLSERIATISKKGIEYFKAVKDQAIKDRGAGMGIMEGANKYLDEILKQADKFGRRAQDRILDQFAIETGSLLKDSIKGTKLEKLADQILPVLGGSKGKVLTSKAGAAATAGAGGIGKVAGFAGAAYSMYQLIDGFGKDSPVASAANGATAGAYIGTAIAPGIGTAIGGIVGGIGGALAGVFGRKKKHPERAARDHMRDLLQQTGFLDKNYGVPLADGSSFSIAIDRKNKLQNLDGGSRFGYQFDPSNPLSHPAIGMLQPLATVLTGGDQKLATDLTGYLVNAVTSNASSLSDVRSNVIAIYANSGAELEDIAQAVAEMADRDIISEDHRDAFIGGIMSVADEETLFALSGKTPESENSPTIH
jgi:hypothetical protein